MCPSNMSADCTWGPVSPLWMGLGPAQLIEHRKGGVARLLSPGQERLGGLAFGAPRLYVRV